MHHDIWRNPGEWRFNQDLDPQDLRFEKVVDFNFDVRRFREPVVQVITGNGWRFRPLLFRPLLWRG